MKNTAPAARIWNKRRIRNRKGKAALPCPCMNSGEGLKADPEKFGAVQDMKRPQSQRELMTFLRFIQYLKNFMPNMADISAPLRKLTEKDVEWKWTETEENSFNKLKKLATEAPERYFIHEESDLQVWNSR